jgi:DNA processing protein
MSTPAPADDPVRRARAYLLRVAEPPALALTALIAARGPVQAAELVRAGAVPGAVLDETSVRRDHDRVDLDFAAAAAVGARLVTAEEDEWPTHLAALSPAAADGARWAAPPVALWVRGGGRLADLLGRAVSVLGARAATGYGEHVSADFGYGLATAHVTVVTGGSYGIEAAALRGALSAGGTAVVVLACGIDIAYPTGNTALLDRVAEHGLLVSEYPPGTRPARHRFAPRSRLLAAASAGSVLVEAGVRSGARTTITLAAALARAVMAVPGPMTSATSRGCHELLRSGTALPVASVAEILQSTTALYPGLRPDPQSPTTD